MSFQLFFDFPNPSCSKINLKRSLSLIFFVQATLITESLVLTSQSNHAIGTLHKTRINKYIAHKMSPYMTSNFTNKKISKTPTYMTTRQENSDHSNDHRRKFGASLKRTRPSWSCHWMPTWLITLHPIVQFLIGFILYVAHLTIFTQRCLVFPFQLIPNDYGKFQSIGYDSLAGIFSMIFLFWLRKQTKINATPAVPSIFGEPHSTELPWNLTHGNCEIDSSDDIVPDNPHLSPSVRAFTYLLIAYTSTGRFTSWIENLLYVAVGMGMPLTIAMHRSLVVLLGHLTWVGIGSLILEFECKPFFNKRKKMGNKSLQTKRRTLHNWYTLKWDTYWLWWAICGYFVSAWAFNMADFLNQIVIPSSTFDNAGEGVVSQLINPENNDIWASIVGYIAPCLSAPWWEEVLYRGFILPALCMHMRFWPASILSSLIFSAHHMSTTGFIPLAVLGMTWATLYAKSGNLLVTILIHAMWNSRVFLGSWFGL